MIRSKIIGMEISIMAPPNLQQIEAILREHRQELAQEYGLLEIGVFGSCVRTEATPCSDIDLLVKFQRPIGFFRFFELQEKLSGYLGAKVDLVTRAALKPHIGKRILSEVVML